MGYGWLNLGSLILGSIAWGLPAVSLLLIGKIRVQYCVMTALSIGACSISLFMQILYQNHLVVIGDWSALMDTSSASALISAVLLAVTIILNAVTLIAYKKIKKGKG